MFKKNICVNFFKYCHARILSLQICDNYCNLLLKSHYHKQNSQKLKCDTWALGIAAGVIILGQKDWGEFSVLSYLPNAYCAKKRENLRKQCNFIADVVEEVVSSVVYIEAIYSGAKIFRHSSGEPLVVSNGSGFIIQHDGLIVTNAHVVMQHGSNAVRVRLSDGTTHPASIENIDTKSDLATLRIQASNLPVMKMGSSSDLRVGEWVMAIGSPLTLSNTVTAGVVSASQRPAKDLGIAHKDINYIQTDASITFGNSGGPLVNLDGEAIGVNSITISAGISFAIPIDSVKQFLDNTKNNRSVTGPSKNYIGITMVTLKPDMVFALQSRGVIPVDITWGVIVWKIQENGPAFRVGLRPGDVITHVNDMKASSVQVIYDALETAKAVRIHAIRNGHPLLVVVEPEISF